MNKNENVIVENVKRKLETIENVVYAMQDCEEKAFLKLILDDFKRASNGSNNDISDHNDSVSSHWE